MQDPRNPPRQTQAGVDLGHVCVYFCKILGIKSSSADSINCQFEDFLIKWIHSRLVCISGWFCVEVSRINRVFHILREAGFRSFILSVFH